MKTIISVFLFTLFIFSCQNAPVYDDPVPEHDIFKIDSEAVNETRVITIWKPPVYEQTGDSLPVLYMPDGGIKEDFPHIANTLAKLIGEKKIPPHILVGIENTNRKRDLTGESKIKEHEKYGIPMTDGAKFFRKFIVDELIPEVNKRYKTTDRKGIIGESLSGLFIIETFFKTPEVFDFYIAMDPSLWWNDNYLVKNADKFLENLPDRETKLWFAGSDTPDIKKYTDEFSEFLNEKSVKNLTYKYSPEPDEKHQTIFRAAKEKALIWMLND